MKKCTKQNLIKTLPVIIFSSLLVVGIIYGWQEPSSAPPGGNVPPPLHQGTTAQTKQGDLNIMGKVGIGTTTPSYKLDVRGNLNSEGSQIEYVASLDNVITSQTSGGTWETLDYTLEGFKFNSGSYTNLAGVALYIKRSTKAAINGWVRVRLYSDNAGVPGSVLAYGATLYANRISTSGGWYYFGLRYGLSANTNYWIIVERSGLEADDIYLDSVTTVSNHVYWNGSAWVSEAKSLRYYVYAYSSRGLYSYSFGSYSPDYGMAIYGFSYTSPGVYGGSQSHYGVRGYSLNSWGGYFSGASGVYGESYSSAGTAVQGYNPGRSGYVFYGLQGYSLFTGEGLRLDMASAGLSKVFFYDGAAFTDRTTTACQSGGSAFTIVGDTDDIMYFGLTSKFTQLQFDIVQAGAGLNLVWEYSAGSGNWNTLTLTYDETKNFTRDGIVTWSDPGASWVTNTVNGVSAYWIRVRTTSVTTAPTAYIACRSGFSGYAIRYLQAGQEKFRVGNQGEVFAAGPIYPGTTTAENAIQTSRYIYDTGSAIGVNTNLYVAGNVGIGTTAPSKKLDVNGDIQYSGGLYQGGTRGIPTADIQPNAVTEVSGITSQTQRSGSGTFEDPDLQLLGVSNNNYPTLILVHIGWAKPDTTTWKKLWINVGGTDYALDQTYGGSSGALALSGQIWFSSGWSGSKDIKVKYTIDSGTLYISEYAFVRSLVVIKFKR